MAAAAKMPAFWPTLCGGSVLCMRACSDPAPKCSTRLYDDPLCAQPLCAQHVSGQPRAIVSFEDFVNGGKECLRNCQAESRRRLGVDGKLELRRLLDRNIARFCSAENFVHHFGGLSEQIRVVRSIRHQTACFDVVVIAHNCW